MSTVTLLLRELLVGRNLAHVARETGLDHTKVWRIAKGKEFADLRTGEAEALHLHLTGKPLVEKEGA